MFYTRLWHRQQNLFKNFYCYAAGRLPREKNHLDLGHSCHSSIIPMILALTITEWGAK
jgi:hypothetical protein